MNLYVGSLHYSTSEAELKELFTEYGEVTSAKIIIDKYSGRSKGFGFVTFPNDEDAKKAIKEMNDKEVEGRNLKVNEARPMEERPPRREGGRSFGGGGGRSGGQRRF